MKNAFLSDSRAPGLDHIAVISAAYPLFTPAACVASDITGSALYENKLFHTVETIVFVAVIGADYPVVNPGIDALLSADSVKILVGNKRLDSDQIFSVGLLRKAHSRLHNAFLAVISLSSAVACSLTYKRTVKSVNRMIVVIVSGIGRGRLYMQLHTEALMPYAHDILLPDAVRLIVSDNNVIYQSLEAEIQAVVAVISAIFCVSAVADLSSVDQNASGRGRSVVIRPVAYISVDSAVGGRSGNKAQAAVDFRIRLIDL